MSDKKAEEKKKKVESSSEDESSEDESSSESSSSSEEPVKKPEPKKAESKENLTKKDEPKKSETASPKPQKKEEPKQDTPKVTKKKEEPKKEKTTKKKEEPQKEAPKKAAPRRQPLSRTKTSGALEVHHVLSPEEEALRGEARFFNLLLFAFQVAIIIIYAIWLDYPTTDASSLYIYGYFRDVNIMIFFGFGLLMTFLRRYGYSAIGYTLLISAMVAQWSIPIQGIVEFDKHKTTLQITMYELVNGLFCAGAVMISYGAVLGKVSPTQLLLMGIIEPLFYWLNIYIVIPKLGGFDVGGGMTIHTFGAYFGLAVTWFLTTKDTRSHKDNTSQYSSDLFSLTGTLFLWIMWPSFNAAVAPAGIPELRAVTNTFLAITSSAIAAFIVSRLISEFKFDIVHIQNSTLAGGVAMGVAAHLNLSPARAIGIGFIAGAISVWGYKYLTPLLARKLNIQDVCGINNLHGMPGILSCLVGIFASLRASQEKDLYSPTQYAILFPKGDEQAGFQAAGLVITISIAIIGGVITGFLMKLAHRINPIHKKDYFNDRTFWNLPSDYDNVFERPEANSVEMKVIAP